MLANVFDKFQAGVNHDGFKENLQRDPGDRILGAGRLPGSR